MSFWNERDVLVTGGAGFIGSHLVDKLVEHACNVTIFDNLSLGLEENINPEAVFVEGDIRDYLSLRRVVENKEVVFHLAANPTTRTSSMGWKDPSLDYEVNAVGTLNVLRAVEEVAGDAVVVYASSAAVYGEPRTVPIREDHATNPISPYGVSKLAGENYCHAYSRETGLRTVILRIFNTYGPRQRRYVMVDLLRKLSENPSVLEVLGDGKQVRDYCYVQDTVDAFLLAGQRAPRFGVFNVGTGVGTTIGELAEMLIRIRGLERKTKVQFTGQTWRGDIRTLVADVSRIASSLGFRPRIALPKGLFKLVTWYISVAKRDNSFETAERAGYAR